SRVAEDIVHQTRPEFLNMENRSRFVGRIGKAVAGHIRHDHIEYIFWLPAVGDGIRQHWNYFEKAAERIGITVGEKEWERARSLAALVDEVDAEAINIGTKVRKLVERGFVATPIVRLRPVFHKLAEVFGICACVPTDVSWMRRPTSSREAFVEICEDGV